MRLIIEINCTFTPEISLHLLSISNHIAKLTSDDLQNAVSSFSNKIYGGNHSVEIYTESAEKLAQYDEAEKAAHDAHITKVGNVYEDFKTKLIEIGAQLLPDAQICFSLLKQLRDLACSQYDPETFNAIHGNNNNQQQMSLAAFKTTWPAKGKNTAISNIPIVFTGPQGSGKSFTAFAVAKFLDRSLVFCHAKSVSTLAEKNLPETLVIAEADNQVQILEAIEVCTGTSLKLIFTSQNHIPPHKAYSLVKCSYHWLQKHSTASEKEVY